jgi:hypothetical protein
MSHIAIDPDAIRDFSFPEDVDDPTIYQLGQIDSHLLAAIYDGQNVYFRNDSGPEMPASFEIKANRRNLDLVKFGLKGWRNFKDSKGKDAEFDMQSYPVPKIGPRNGVSERCLRMLGRARINRLAAELSSDNILSGQERRD